MEREIDLVLDDLRVSVPVMTYSPQDLFKEVRSILNKLTPEKFSQLMKQVTDLPIDTEERLNGVVDLVFEKAIDEPSFSVTNVNMCRCLATVSRSLSWQRSVRNKRVLCLECNCLNSILRSTKILLFRKLWRIHQMIKVMEELSDLLTIYWRCVNSVSICSQQLAKCLCSKWINWFTFSSALMQNYAVKSNTIQNSVMM